LSHVTNKNESFHTYEWVNMNESCHTYELAESCLTDNWVMSHMWMSQYEWGMSHIWMGHITHTEVGGRWWARRGASSQRSTWECKPLSLYARPDAKACKKLAAPWLQHTATNCNTLQHTSTRCPVREESMQFGAVCCSVLQCVAVCGSVLLQCCPLREK